MSGRSEVRIIFCLENRFQKLPSYLSLISTWEMFYLPFNTNVFNKLKIGFVHNITGHEISINCNMQPNIYGEFQFSKIIKKNIWSRSLYFTHCYSIVRPKSCKNLCVWINWRNENHLILFNITFISNTIINNIV